jgi:GntR family transcriptional regulator
MRSFTEEMRARGFVPHSRLLGFRVAHPSAGARDFFGLPQHESVYRIERLRYAGITPLAVEAVEMPCHLCPNLVRFNLATHSLYNVLEGEYGLRLARCLETISARPASRQERKLLELPRGVAVLLIERRSYTSNDTPVEMGVSRYRADLYRAVVHSRRTAL